MAKKRNILKRIQSEATSRFVGKNGVVGVGITDPATKAEKLVVFLKHRQPDQERIIRKWAKLKGASIDFIVVGQFLGGSAA
jgi:hypothetical protein